MRIKYFQYNAFLVEEATTKIAIDPGLNLWIGKLNSLIPKSEWGDVTHVLATHGDPDHCWYVDRVARSAKAPVICGKALVKENGQERLLLDPRKRRIRYSTKLDRLYPLEVGQAVDVDGVRIEGIKTVHGPLVLSLFFGLLRHEIAPGPGERIGMGNIGFKITVGETTLVNLGDTLLQQEWEGLKADVLMIPIGGRLPKNTMNEDEALAAVELIAPKLVIPCHYDGAFFWIRDGNSADVRYFQKQVESRGAECRVMGYGEEITI